MKAESTERILNNVTLMIWCGSGRRAPLKLVKWSFENSELGKSLESAPSWTKWGVDMQWAYGRPVRLWYQRRAGDGRQAVMSPNE